MHGDAGVAGAGAAGDEHHAGQSGQLGVGHRHEAGAALAAAGDQVQPVVRVQRVEQGDVALARHAEGAVDALGGEEVHELFGGGGHAVSRSFPWAPDYRSRQRLQTRVRSVARYTGVR